MPNYLCRIIRVCPAVNPLLFPSGCHLPDSDRPSSHVRTLCLGSSQGGALRKSGDTYCTSLLLYRRILPTEVHMHDKGIGSQGRSHCPDCSVTKPV